MERTYAAWTRGAKPEDVELIKAAFAGRPPGYDYSADTSRHRRRRYSKRPLKSPGAVTKLSTEAVVEGINAPGVAVETEESKAVSPFIREKLRRNRRKKIWLGWKNYSALRASPLRGRPPGVDTLDYLGRLATARYEQLKSYNRATPGVILPVVARTSDTRDASKRRNVRNVEVCFGRWQDYSARTGLTPSGPPSGR